MKPIHVLVVVLIVIALLFVLAVTVGLGKPEKLDRPGDPDAVGILSKLTEGAPFMHPSEALGCTPTGNDEFSISQACAIEFGDRGLLAKPTKVALQVDSGSVLVLVAPKVGPELQTRVPRTVRDSDGDEETQDCFGMSMSPKGGTITLIPQGGAPAELEILSEECEE